MKNFYIAVTIREDEKYYSYVIKVNSSDNLLSKLKIKNIVTANISSTKKEAKELVKTWNTQAIYKHSYLFDETF